MVTNKTLIDKYEDSRSLEVEEVVRKQSSGGVTFVIFKTNRKFPFKIARFDTEDGKVVFTDDSVNIEEKDEAVEMFERTASFDKAAEVAAASEYFRERGYTVLDHDISSEFYDMLEVRYKKNPDVQFSINLPQLKSKSYRFAYRHRDVISKIVDRRKDSEDVFYSNISNMLDDELPSASPQSKTMVFSAITDSLENNGVRVHS